MIVLAALVAVLGCVAVCVLAWLRWEARGRELRRLRSQLRDPPPEQAAEQAATS